MFVAVIFEICRQLLGASPQTPTGAPPLYPAPSFRLPHLIISKPATSLSNDTDKPGFDPSPAARCVLIIFFAFHNKTFSQDGKQQGTKTAVHLHVSQAAAQLRR